MKRDSFDNSKNQDDSARSNRRLTERIPTEFSVMYSGMRTGHMLMGNGMVANLSDRGIGICGNRLVIQGMELALFIDLPGAEEPVCIAQSRVSWVSGRRFGVEMLSPTSEAHNQLRFHMWNSRSRPPSKR
jgi:hypothetical protein